MNLEDAAFKMKQAPASQVQSQEEVITPVDIYKRADEIVEHNISFLDPERYPTRDDGEDEHQKAGERCVRDFDNIMGQITRDLGALASEDGGDPDLREVYAGYDPDALRQLSDSIRERASAVVEERFPSQRVDVIVGRIVDNGAAKQSGERGLRAFQELASEKIHKIFESEKCSRDELDAFKYKFWNQIGEKQKDFISKMTPEQSLEAFKLKLVDSGIEIKLRSAKSNLEAAIGAVGKYPGLDAATALRVVREDPVVRETLATAVISDLQNWDRRPMYTLGDLKKLDPTENLTKELFKDKRLKDALFNVCVGEATFNDYPQNVLGDLEDAGFAPNSNDVLNVGLRAADAKIKDVEEKISRREADSMTLIHAYYEVEQIEKAFGILGSKLNPNWRYGRL